MKKNDSQINLRIPSGLKQKIATAAKNEARSINSEIIFRLEESFEMQNNILLEADKIIYAYSLAREPSKRKDEVSERLNYLLEEVTKSKAFKNLTIARLAANIGEESAHNTEYWFEGRMEPTFNQLIKVADALSVNHDWLLFGEKPLFKTDTCVFHGDLLLDAAWLTQPNPDKSFLENETVEEIAFMRYAIDSGSLVIAKRYSNNYLELFSTNYNFIETVSEREIEQLQYVYKLYDFMVSGLPQPRPFTGCYALSPKDTQVFESDTTHVLATFEQLKPGTWIEDLLSLSTDDNEVHQHWDGFGALYKKFKKHL